MRVALVSLDQFWLDKENNFTRCVKFVHKAAEDGCELVFFPEMTLTGFSLDALSIVETPNNAMTFEWFGELSSASRVSVIFGACLIDQQTSNPRNVLCLAQQDGTVQSLYAKIHPFNFVGEDKVYDAGNSLEIVNVGALRLGCSICYDLRFPELYSIMSKSCNAVVNIANWPASRLEHWKSLLVARAIENQLFVIGVNRTGLDGNGLQYKKSSMVVSPDGKVLEPLYSEGEFDIYEVDPVEVTDYREAFPVVSDKRYELYAGFYQNIMQEEPYIAE